MKTIRMLLATGSAIALVSGMPALAKPAHQAAPSAQSEEIRALRAQVEALTARLDAQEASQHAAQQQAESAQTQAAAAQQQAQAAQSAATAATAAVPTEVKTALAAQPKPKPQWFDNTSISGRMYFNFSNINQKVNGLDTANEGTGFNIKRFYLSVDHKFDNIFSADLTTDVDNVVGSTSKQNFVNGTANLVGKGLYIKKAYLQAKLDPAFIIRLGSADMPWIPFIEGIYGYRHIDPTLIDRTSFGQSADWGIHVLGDVGGGILSYQFSVVDGAGYRNVKVTNSVDFEGRVSAAYKGFFAAVGGYSGKLGNNVQSTASPPVPSTFRTATRFDAAAGYKDKRFTIAGEYFTAKNWTSNGQTYITSPTLFNKAEGYSVFGSVAFMPKLSAFGRYDWVKPSQDINPALHDRYFNVGLQYSPANIVDLALVYKRDKAENGTIGTSNGTIGGSINGAYDEIGLFGQFRF